MGDRESGRQEFGKLWWGITGATATFAPTYLPPAQTSRACTHTHAGCRQAATTRSGMWIPTPDSQGLEFLQRGVRCEDVKEADHLRGREEAKTLRGALRPETRGKSRKVKFLHAAAQSSK